MQQKICYLKGNGKRKSQENFRYLVSSYLRLEGITDFEGNRPGNHQNSLKSRPGNNKGIKYHRWLYIDSGVTSEQVIGDHDILLIIYLTIDNRNYNSILLILLISFESVTLLC